MRSGNGLEEYFANREVVKMHVLGDSPSQANVVFANERPDAEFVKSKLEIQHSTFASIGFRKSKISDSKFSAFS